ncbi:hypothetical protein H4F17_18670 [Vibrio cholerae]
MASTIREQLIAAGIIVPAANPTQPEKKAKQNSSKRSSKVDKKLKKESKASHHKKNSKINRTKADDNQARKPLLKPRPKRKLSKVDRAILQASSCGRRDGSELRKPERIRLFVRRGATVKGDVACDTCGCVYGILTRYSNTSVGPVVLCTTCKVKAFEANFGHADAMPLKVDHAHAQRHK